MSTWIPRPAINLIRRWEGLHRIGKDGLVYPYLCPARVWTQGYGMTIGINANTPPITQQEATVSAVRLAARFAVDTYRLCPVLLDEDDKRIGAVISWTYNLGAGALGSSTMRRRINERNWAEAAKECRKWVMSGGRILPGLVARREVEAIYLAG